MPRLIFFVVLILRNAQKTLVKAVIFFLLQNVVHLDFV